MTIAEHELEFHRRTIEQARGAGLSAYVLNDNGSVLRIWPDGTKQFIVVRHGLWSQSDPRDASRPTLNSAKCGWSRSMSGTYATTGRKKGKRTRWRRQVRCPAVNALTEAD